VYILGVDVSGVDAWQLLISGLLGLIGGSLSGLGGVGGGIFFVPALVYVVGWGIKEAVAASLVVVIFSSLSGTIRNARSEDPVDWRNAALLSSTVAPASLIGVAISSFSPDVVVKLAFAALLIVLAYPMARGRPDFDETSFKIPTALVLVAGAGIGALSGLVGVGGGVLMVPLMVLGLGVRTKVAVSTSLAVVLATGILASAGYLATGFGRLSELPPLIVGSMVGAWIGVRLRDLLPDRAIRIGFAVFMAVVALRVIGDAAGIL
jgi:uncharacterized membrane protein YfcA